jgi:hypothetical protein
VRPSSVPQGSSTVVRDNDDLDVDGGDDGPGFEQKRRRVCPTPISTFPIEDG